MSTEDGLADTIKPRLKVMGADPKRVFAVNTTLTLDPDGFKQLESYLKDKRPMLVIIDPLFLHTLVAVKTPTELPTPAQ